MPGFDPLDYPCAGCEEYTTPQRDAASASSRMTEFGRVDQVDDVCPSCGHVMVENLTGPGARAWTDARAFVICDDNVMRKKSEL